MAPRELADRLLPRVKLATVTGGHLTSPHTFDLHLEGFSRTEFHLSPDHWLPILGGGAESRGGNHQIRLILRKLPTAPRGRESYTLEITPSSVILASDSCEGIFRASRTFAQLLFLAGRQPIPCLRILDFPDFAERAFMLDISRGKVPLLEELKLLVDLLANCKYNQLQLYVEHVFAWKNHAVVWGDASPLTATDIQELQLYCKNRYIELVPNLNCLGHFERWIRHPEYHHLADHPDGFRHPLGVWRPNGTTLRPNDESIRFLRGLYEEYLPLHESEWFHLGGDEPWDLGLGWSRELCRTRGRHRVYLDHILRVHQTALPFASRHLLWADVLLEDPQAASELPESLLPVVWGYLPQSPIRKHAQALAGMERNFWVAPSVRGFLSLTGYSAQWENLPNAAVHGLSNGASGMLVTEWGDRGHHQFSFVAWPGLLWGGALAWNTKGSEKRPDIGRAISDHILRETSPVLGPLISRLAEINNRFLPYEPVTSPLHRFLFSDRKEVVSYATSFPGTLLQGCIAEIEEILGMLDSAGGERPDCLVRQEMALAATLAKLGLERAMHVLTPRSESARRLRSGVQTAIGTYERLWLARNRPGGLAESANYLRFVVADLAGDVS